MAPRDRQHIFVRRPATAEPYRRRPRRIPARALPEIRDRSRHGVSLSGQLESVESESLQRRSAREQAANGIYVVFESFPDIELALERLDPRGKGRHPELLTVQTTEIDGRPVQRATVYIPDGKLGYFLKRLTQYVETTSADRPKHRELVERIQRIAMASIRELWTDDEAEFPAEGQETWWEVWLRGTEDSALEGLKEFASRQDLTVGPHVLRFPDRTVALLLATPDDLANAPEVLDDLAELRKPRVPTVWLSREDVAEQARWIDELKDRTTLAPESAPAVSLFDTGVSRGHPLLEDSLATRDRHACESGWGLDDHDGHGTEMAGLALYRNLGDAIVSPEPFGLQHRLESVKILPPSGTNPPELYGALMATGASLVEIEQPARRRAFCVAVSAGYPDGVSPIILGQPTSWSSAIDALAAGLSIATSPDGLVFLDEAEDAAHRLFLLSAGNVPRLGWNRNHLDISDLHPVEDPGQAWNALTIGAYTELDSLDGADPSFRDWIPVAPRGELSPFSRTSVAWRSWPLKPEVVLEGGNVASSPSGTDFDTPDELQLLTTRRPQPGGRLLTTICATSAATAQASWFASQILAEFPSLWPETVRALIVHSAQWTEAMRLHFDGASMRAPRVALRRRYGMGVPDLLRATRSATDALTLIVEETIHPFEEGKTREMHLHELPWPAEVLRGLGETEVRLRVTLSYFIQPNPSRRGWVRRYQYASHGLRFDVRRATESTADFRQRINALAEAEEDRRQPAGSDAAEWFFGPENRVSGSLHADFWNGTAADLAQRGVVGIYPVTGWWKDQPRRDRSDAGVRYSLIVSIESPGVDVDIWTPVAQEVGVPIVIET